MTEQIVQILLAGGVMLAIALIFGAILVVASHFLTVKKNERTEAVEKLLAQSNLNVEESEIKAESNFKEDLGADSLDLFELVMPLEEELVVEFPSENLESIPTVNGVIENL